MEVRIGVQNVARELSIDTESSAETVLADLANALENDRVLTISDAKGGTIAVPAATIAYVHVSEDTGRKVGFGL